MDLGDSWLRIVDVMTRVVSSLSLLLDHQMKEFVIEMRLNQSNVIKRSQILSASSSSSSCTSISMYL